MWKLEISKRTFVKLTDLGLDYKAALSIVNVNYFHEKSMRSIDIFILSQCCLLFFREIEFMIVARRTQIQHVIRKSPIQFNFTEVSIFRRKEKKKRSFPNFSFRVTILNSDGEKFMQSFTDPLFNVTHFANAGLLWIQVQAKGPSGFSNTIHIGKICRKY